MFGLSRCLVRVVPAVALLALGVACSPPKAPTPVPRVLALQVETSAQLNPDIRQRASPVVLRVYRLRSPLSFEAADFFSLVDKERATLSDDLVSREELQLRPGQSLAVPARELEPDARVIAVLAEFRDLENSRWRALATVPEPPPPVVKLPPKPVTVTATITLGPRDVRVAVH